MDTAHAFKIFIVEDDEWFRNLLCHAATLNPDFEIKPFATADKFLKALDEKPDVVSLDYFLPDGKGEDLLKQIRSSHPETEVLIVSKQDKLETAVELLKAGAYDYIIKSDDISERFINTLNNIYKKRKLQHKVKRLEKELDKKYNFSNSIIGSSAAIQSVFGLMEKAAGTNLTVLVTGETGTGKELVAKAIHYNSPRKKEPFVAVNMAAIPGELAESELFGHEKGAFTGAVQQRKGRFEQASGGTLFLDEIGELDPSLQSKLLRVLQEKELTRVGGSELIRTDCRIIAASNRNLAEEVKAGKFREDLFYRLYGLTIHLPPLRDRREDIISITESCIESFCRENKRNAPSLDQEARRKLLGHSFPGNVRELKSVAELAVVLCNGSTITASDIQLNNDLSLHTILSEERTLEEYDKEIVNYFLKKYNQNVILVAEKLGIGKSTIYRLLKEDPQFFGGRRASS